MEHYERSDKTDSIVNVPLQVFSSLSLYQTFGFHFIETKIHPDHSAVKMNLRHLPAVSFGQAEMNYKWK